MIAVEEVPASDRRAKYVADHVAECMEIARRIAADPLPIGINASELAAATILALAINDAGACVGDQVERVNSTLTDIEQTGIGGR